MAPPEKEANISENDSTVVAADRPTTVHSNILYELALPLARVTVTKENTLLAPGIFSPGIVRSY